VLATVAGHLFLGSFGLRRPPGGNTSDYVFVMEFEGDRIRHMTKIWNDVFAMRQLGWG